MNIISALTSFVMAKLQVIDPGPGGRSAEGRFERYIYAWWNGWRWAVSRGGWRRGPVVVLRELYWSYVRGYISESCWFCGRPMPLIWWADDDIWKQFSGNSGICCPECFDERAWRAGALLVWRPLVYRLDGVTNAATVREVWGVVDGEVA